MSRSFGERISSLALVPLGLWLVSAALTLAGGDYETAVAFVRQPLDAVLLALLVAVGFWHMQSGMRAIVEDYFGGFNRVVLLAINLFVSVLVGALAIFCILKVALGGA